MKAFTLIELAIVVLLIGILSGAAYPSLSTMYYNFQLEGAVTNMAGDIRFILNESLSHKEIVQTVGTGEVYLNVCYALEITSDRCYRLYRYSWDQTNSVWTANNQLTPDTYLPAGAVISNFDSIKNAAGDIFRLVYSNRGEPTSDGSTSLSQNLIQFTSPYTGMSKNLIIDQNTGKPRIE